MQDYELVAIVSPELDEDGVSKIVDRMAQSISGRGGDVEEVKNWGKRKLAYPVKRFMEGDYVLARFKLMPKSVKELEKEIDALEDILRYLMVKVSD